MGTHPIFESDFDCLTEENCHRQDMQLGIFILASAVASSSVNNLYGCGKCFEADDYLSCMVKCDAFRNLFESPAVEKRSNLRAICLKNPRARPCLEALQANHNLMW